MFSLVNLHSQFCQSHFVVANIRALPIVRSAWRIWDETRNGRDVLRVKLHHSTRVDEDLPVGEKYGRFLRGLIPPGLPTKA